MNSPYKDPNIEKLYNDLLQLNLKSLTPSETSETWEVVKLLYKAEQRKRWKKVLWRVSIGLAASVAIGAVVVKLKYYNDNKDEA